LPQVERDAELVAIHRMKNRCSPVVQRGPPVARMIAAAGRLDLDHLGTELAEHEAGERRSDAVADLHHDRPVERRATGHADGSRN